MQQLNPTQKLDKHVREEWAVFFVPTKTITSSGKIGLRVILKIQNSFITDLIHYIQTLISSK